MTVIGSASISAKPDVVTIRLEVTTQNRELTQAQQENAQKMDQVIQALVQLGISREAIQTAAYTIQPQYDYVDGKQIFRGYEVIHALTVRLNAVDQAGTVIDTSVQNGVNRVSDIEFSVDDPNAYYQRALSDALRNATAKAETIAKTIDVNLDPRPIKIVEEGSRDAIVQQTFAATKVNVSTSLEPSQLIFSATLRTKFQYFG